MNVSSAQGLFGGLLVFQALGGGALGAILGVILHHLVGRALPEVVRAPTWVWGLLFAGPGVASAVYRIRRAGHRHARRQALLPTLSAEQVPAGDADFTGWSRRNHIAGTFALARADLRLVIFDVRPFDNSQGEANTVVQVTRPGLELPTLTLVPIDAVGRVIARISGAGLDIAPNDAFARRFSIHGDEPTARVLLTPRLVDLMLCNPGVGLQCLGDTFAVTGPAWRSGCDDDTPLVHFALQVLDALAAARGADAESTTGPR